MSNTGIKETAELGLVVVSPTQRPGEEGDFEASVKGISNVALGIWTGTEFITRRVQWSHGVTAQHSYSLRHWCDVEFMELA